MSGRRRTWVDAFDRVPVTFSPGEKPAGGETGPARLRLDAHEAPARRRSALALVRAVITRLRGVAVDGITSVR
jgi:hypothetical protein